MGIGHSITRFYTLLLAAAAATACLGGCAPNQPRVSVPVAVDGRIVVEDNLNPNLQGRPSPLHLRVYQLTDSDVFMRASFQELATTDAVTLAGTLLRRDAYDLCPREMGREPLGGGTFCQGDSLPITFELEPSARYVGVVAEFSDLLDPAGNWRSLAEVTARPGRKPTSVRFTITLQRATVSARFD